MRRPADSEMTTRSHRGAATLVARGQRTALCLALIQAGKLARRVHQSGCSAAHGWSAASEHGLRRADVGAGHLIVGQERQFVEVDGADDPWRGFMAVD